MPRGLPDYYNPDTLISQRLANVEEIVTQQRGFASLDNRGRTLFFDRFEVAGGAWISANSGDASNPDLDGNICYVRPTSIVMAAGTLTGVGVSWMIKRFLLGATSRLGIETALGYRTGACTYHVSITYNLDGEETLAELRVLDGSGDISIYTGGAFVSVGNVGFNAGATLCWLPVKLVADYANDIYLRLVVGQEEIDLSDYALDTSSVAEAGLAEITLKCVADDDVANSGHYGYAIITVDEP